ncbi:MAG: hypothetical protein U5N26_07390 [Candidatus Marinimicrobia bacterium]|nr:hypothetical protein [Candidatus Neomarinimicrobiota bacterium]
MDQLRDEDYNRIGAEVLNIDIRKRSFLTVFRHVVKHSAQSLADVLRASHRYLNRCSAEFLICLWRSKS